MKNFEFYLPTELIFGQGEFGRLGEVARPYGQKALLVTGKSSMKKLGFTDMAIKLCRDAGIEVVLYDDVIPNPTTELIDLGAEMCRKNGCDLVIALGGGSAMDSAKGIAIAATHGRPIWDHVRHGVPVTEKTLPIIAVTSTSGTGSHVTPYTVITNPETKGKPGYTSYYIYPKVSIVDVDILRKMPPDLTANVGMDVLAHSIESHINVRSAPISDLLSGEAIRILYRYLPKAYENGDDLESRAMMALADTYAGMALAEVGAALAHAIAHAISGHYPEVSHGLALTQLYPAFLSFTARSRPEKFGNICSWLGGDGTPEGCSQAYRKFAESIGFRFGLRYLGINQSDFGSMAEDTLDYMKGSAEKNPVRATEDDVSNMLEELF